MVEALFRFAKNNCLGACMYDMVIDKSEIHEKLQFSVFMIAGSYWGLLPNAGHVQTACCGHHCTYKGLREAFWGQSASGTILFQYGVAWVSLWVSFWHAVGPGKKKKKMGIKQHIASYNLNVCQRNETSHCIPRFAHKHKYIN